MTFPEARGLIDGACAAHAFPAAAIEVGRRAGPLWQETFGTLSYDAGAAAVTLDTIFDLASLTKVIATTSMVMRAITARRLTLDMRVADLVDEWRGADREPVEVHHLLSHSSGLPAHARLWNEAAGREAYRAAICALPLERVAGSASVYSDPGFILLGLLLEDILGVTLDSLIDQLRPAVKGDWGYRPPPEWVSRTAPTELDAWRGRILQAEVHDENAAAIGGVAGHAGLFGTVTAVGAFARLVLEAFKEDTLLGTPVLMRRFASRVDIPNSSRALGWDTMLPTSSCGTLMSPTAIGHTGFTGTSLWIDHERDVYVVLLTNRVHPTRQNEALVALRPRVHDAVLTELGARR